MRGAGDHFSVGDRIAFYRRRRQLTQRVLAQLVARSEDWLSKVERNERDVRRHPIYVDRSPVWTGKCYVDGDTGEVLPTWDEAMAGLDADPDARLRAKPAGRAGRPR